jgi:phospholipid/cholesterol/gamma-HCH transport system permease protein
MSVEPDYAIEQSGEGLRLRLTGSWTIGSRGIESKARALVREGKAAEHVSLDLADVSEMDTAGAWLIDRSRVQMSHDGAQAVITRPKAPHAILLDEARHRSFEVPEGPRGLLILNLLAELGENVAWALKDFINGIAFLGRVVTAFGQVLFNPARLRMTSVIYHIESFGFRGLPIIVLINFLVGCIVAQQGLFQLKRFGASTFTVDLIGILVLRELAVLLTSIMVAGRSGSAITAEIGSMKMREEIDALRVMGMDPTEVLVVPRLLALIISLPLLTFLSDIAALFGGLVVTWTYGGISPEVFMARLQSAIAFNTFMVGLIKAPFMALVIGMIAAIEGLAVEGSAESLGRQVTSSVVKSIFMVIVVDGLFAMFFAAIDY